MNKNFQAKCQATLIGSLPLTDHTLALKLVLEHTPDIPVWVQLPVYKQEGMVSQFLPGLPAVVFNNDKVFVDTESNDFDDEILAFYEDYFAVTDGNQPLSGTRFALTSETAGGFFALTNHLDSAAELPTAVKGQVTGPFTFCTSISDQNDQAVFYNDQLKDIAIKLLAQKARWQARQLLRYGRPVIIFFDEPALAGFGSSEFISVSRDEIKSCLEEVFDAVHSEGALAGIHICANTDWSLVLESSADIVNFDAYAYFDRFFLYPQQIKYFIQSGRVLAWGIVPTLSEEYINAETTETLLAAFRKYIKEIESLGIDRMQILRQSLITPSCGAGSLSIVLAGKVLQMTRDVSQHLRRELAAD